MRRHLIWTLPLCAILTVGLGLGWLVFSLRWSPDLLSPRLIIPQIESPNDKDGDGLNDTRDLINGARQEIKRQPTYHSAYYQGGFPPENEGVCTDLIWRAFKQAGYELKSLVDADIKRRTQNYPRTDGKPDPNIDFRRVPNLNAFLKQHAQSLTLEIKPGDLENLKNWQGGDIVVFGKPHEHIALVSDTRRRDGVPLILHNSGPSPREDDGLLYWRDNLAPIIGHYRWSGK